MVTETAIYWITRLDGIRAMFTTAAVVCGVIFGLTLILRISCILSEYPIISGTSQELNAVKILKRIMCYSGIVSVISAIILAFVPSTKEAAAIVIIPKVVNSDFIQKKAPQELEELYRLTKDYLRSSLSDKQKQPDEIN